MTYIVKVWNDSHNKLVLKAFDKDKPIYVTEAKWIKGAPVQECGRESEAQRYIDKIDRYEHWKGRAIVELH